MLNTKKTDEIRKKFAHKTSTAINEIEDIRRLIMDDIRLNTDYALNNNAAQMLLGIVDDTLEQLEILKGNV